MKILKATALLALPLFLASGTSRATEISDFRIDSLVRESNDQCVKATHLPTAKTRVLCRYFTKYPRPTAVDFFKEVPEESYPGFFADDFAVYSPKKRQLQLWKNKALKETIRAPRDWQLVAYYSQSQFCAAGGQTVDCREVEADTNRKKSRSFRLKHVAKVRQLFFYRGLICALGDTAIECKAWNQENNKTWALKSPDIEKILFVRAGPYAPISLGAALTKKGEMRAFEFSPSHGNDAHFEAFNINWYPYVGEIVDLASFRRDVSSRDKVFAILKKAGGNEIWQWNALPRQSDNGQADYELSRPEEALLAEMKNPQQLSTSTVKVDVNDTRVMHSTATLCAASPIRTLCLRQIRESTNPLREMVRIEDNLPLRYLADVSLAESRASQGALPDMRRLQGFYEGRCFPIVAGRVFLDGSQQKIWALLVGKMPGTPVENVVSGSLAGLRTHQLRSGPDKEGRMGYFGTSLFQPSGLCVYEDEKSQASITEYRSAQTIQSFSGGDWIRSDRASVKTSLRSVGDNKIYARHWIRPEDGQAGTEQLCEMERTISCEAMHPENRALPCAE